MGIEYVRVRRSRQWQETETDCRAQRVYLVKCTDPADGPDAAAAACPDIGDAFSETDLGLVVTSKNAESYQDSTVHFEVTCEFATTSRDPAQQQEDPLLRPQIVSLRFDSFEEPVYQEHPSYDVEGDAAKAIRNSANQIFPDGISENHTYPVITITRNEAAFDYNLAEAYVDTINAAQFSFWHKGVVYTVGAGKALMRNITCDDGYENGIAYDQVTYEIAILSVGWDRKIVDQGYQEDTGEDGIKPILDANGDEVTTPALLDGAGQQLAAAFDPVFLTFRTKARTDFTVFEFDTWNVPTPPPEP